MKKTTIISEEEKKRIISLHSKLLNEDIEFLTKMKKSFYSLMPGNKNMVDDIIKKLEDIFNKEDKPIEDIIDDNPELKDKISNIDLTGIKIAEPSISDKEFYGKILKGIGAPITPQNMLFFYSWRQAEGAKATFNPFNTTKKMEKQSFWNCLKKKDGKCVGGVKNYSSKEDGITATIETLKNGRYKCIVDGLKNDIGAKKIAQCSSLKTWGTGELVSKVLNGSSIKPPEISRTLVKKI
jgi:hypothetical protein